MLPTRRTTVVILSLALLVGPLVACSDSKPAPAAEAAGHAPVPHDTPGPIDRGFAGAAYPVPTHAPAGHPNAVQVTVQNSDGAVVGTDFVPAGTAVQVHPVAGRPDQVAIAWTAGNTAVAPRSQFWAMPPFVHLQDVTVPVNGVEVPLATSGIRYQRGSVRTFDVPLTNNFDGLVSFNREFLACRRDTWGMGGQTFAIDVVEDGVYRNDRAVFEKGIQAVDWGVSVPINDKGIHELHRSCDGKTVADFGYTHHTTQWLESLSRATYLIAASPWAGEYHDRIQRYRHRIEKIASLLMVPANRDYWISQVKDAYGNDFTHRPFMRAAAMGMASTLTDKPRQAAAWAADARQIAMRGVHNQLPSGIDPERGGFDVLYQMYGVWLAELYDGTLPPTSPMKRTMDRTIGRAIDWMTTRVDRTTGKIKIRGTTRICVEELWTSNKPAPFVDPAETIRAFLLWDHLHHEPRLTDLAVLLDRGFKQTGDKCPRDYHAKPEQKATGS